jgi:hypothetical protein
MYFISRYQLHPSWGPRLPVGRLAVPQPQVWTVWMAAPPGSGINFKTVNKKWFKTNESKTQKTFSFHDWGYMPTYTNGVRLRGMAISLNQTQCNWQLLLNQTQRSGNCQIALNQTQHSRNWQHALYQTQRSGKWQLARNQTQRSGNCHLSTCLKSDSAQWQLSTCA